MSSEQQEEIVRLFNEILETGKIPDGLEKHGERVIGRAKSAKNFVQMNTGKGLDGFKILDWTMARAWMDIFKIPLWCPSCERYTFPVNFYANAEGSGGWYCDDCKPDGYMKYTNFSQESVRKQYGDLFEKMAANLEKKL